MRLFDRTGSERWKTFAPGFASAVNVSGDGRFVGWHFNQGSEREALFYPAGHFRERFYRPDVISLGLETLDVQLALQQANDAQKAAARSPLVVR